MILAAAAVSALPLHGAAILDQRGELVASQCFDRTYTPEPDAQA
jgi:hypothetical protein